MTRDETKPPGLSATSEKLNLNVNTVLAITSILYIITAGAGLVYSVLYYKEFSIDISHYIGLDECLLLFMPKIRAIGSFFVLSGIMSWAAHEIWRGKAEELKCLKCIGLVILTALIVMPFTNFNLMTVKAAFFILIPAVMIFFTGILKWYENKRKLKIIMEYRVLIYLAFIFIYGTVALSLFNASFVRSYKKINQAVIFYDDCFYSTDKKEIYIGRTKNYIFFYDTSINRATIIPAEGVKSLELTK